jgi:hypothetical protein
MLDQQRIVVCGRRDGDPSAVHNRPPNGPRNSWA